MVSRRYRVAMTLIELLTVIAIIGVLIALLFPALMAARASSRESACRNNLRQIGLGLTNYADAQGGYYCSGAFDWRRDGVPTESSWVADLVSLGFQVDQLLCPSNEARLSKTYNDLLNATVATPGFSCGVDHFGKTPSVAPTGEILVNPCRLILGAWTGSWTAPWGTMYSGGTPLAPGSEERRRLVEELVLLKGYNTNYAASWWLARGGLELDRNGNLPPTTGNNDFGAACPAAATDERRCTSGPLSHRTASSWAVPMSNVPFMADAATGRPDEAILSQQMGDNPEGSRLAEPMSRGPIAMTTMQALSFPPGTSAKGTAGWIAGWHNEAVQDYRNFSPVHGTGSKRRCLILFGDGSVRSYTDTNADRFLNTGFDPAVYTGGGEIGVTDGDLEFPRQEVHTGWSARRGFAVP